MLCLNFGDETSTRNYVQWTAVFTFFILMVQVGTHSGWPSPNIARFTNNNSEVLLTQDEISWIASSSNIGAAAGAILGPLSVKFFGPKRTGLIAFAFFSVTWSCLLVANNFVWFFVGRFISGTSMVIAFTCTSIFLGEISRPVLRGTMISIVLTGTTIGKILGTYLEAYFSAVVTCPVYLIQCLVGAILLIFVLPESPYFLVRSGDLGMASKSISMYFLDENVEEKLQAVKIYLEAETYTGEQKGTRSVKPRSTLKLLLFIIILYALTESSGFTNVVSYMEVILIRGKSFIIEPKNFVIFDNVFSLVLRLATCNVIDKVGRKFLLVMSSISIGVIFSLLGFYFYLLHSNFDLDNYRWVPMLCLFLFKCSFSVGFFTTFYTLLSELFPDKIKNLANSLALLTGSLLNFVLAKIFLSVSDSIGEQYMFWIHSLSAFLVTPFVLLFLPETKGKKLEEI